MTTATATTTTKCIDLSNVKVTCNSINFVKEMNPVDLNFIDPFSKPNEYKNIELVRKAVLPQMPVTSEFKIPARNENNSSINVDYKEEPFELFDIMFAYDDDRTKGTLYLGYWNDGIV